MMSIAVQLLDLAKNLLSMGDKLRAAQKERRAEMAALFLSVSQCLALVSAEIRAGQVPHGRCGELSMYATMLPAAVQDELGPVEADRLGELLQSAHDVEGMAIQITGPGRDTQLALIEEASGKMAALANMVRVGI